MRIKNYTQKEYKKEVAFYKYPPYWDEGLRLKGRLQSFEQRMYKTWKYNRKKQYKS